MDTPTPTAIKLVSGHVMRVRVALNMFNFGMRHIPWKTLSMCWHVCCLEQLVFPTITRSDTCFQKSNVGTCKETCYGPDKLFSNLWKANKYFNGHKMLKQLVKKWVETIMDCDEAWQNNDCQEKRGKLWLIWEFYGSSLGLYKPY